MTDDPRIKRVLKRYKKGEQFFDASIDITHLGLTTLLQACRCSGDDSLSAPRELGDYALAELARLTGMDFDRLNFDYYLHSYVRAEFLQDYYTDPSVTSKPAPENGPPGKIPLPRGMRWLAVRPKDGKEQFEAYEAD
jgi:hypothetical protein